MLQDERASDGERRFWPTIPNKLKEPSVVAATAASIACLLSILLLATRPGSTTDAGQRPNELRELKIDIAQVRALVAQLADQKGRGREQAEDAGQRPNELRELKIDIAQVRALVAQLADQKDRGREQADVEEALEKATEYLDKKDFALAYDFLLVASRLSATDPRLFDAALKFIGQAKDSQDDEVVALAEDLLDRGDSLVHFQSPRLVESARKRLAEVREKFPTPQKKPEPEPRSEPIRRLIQISNDKSFPAELRSKAAERARNALDEAWIDSVQSSKDQVSDLKPDEIKQLQQQTDEAEKRCITELFDRNRTSAEAWLRTSRGLIDENKDASPKELPGVSEKIGKAITQGMDRLQEILPYAKSEVEGAQKLSSDLENQVKRLQRLKAWIYNLQALRLLREIEENKPSWAAMEKIKILAGISEDLLSPYVMQRFGGIWEKVFESLGDEVEKVEATRLRILRANE